MLTIDNSSKMSAFPGTLLLAVAIASDDNDIQSGPFGLGSTLKDSLSISLKYFKIDIHAILLKAALLFMRKLDSEILVKMLTLANCL